MNLFHAAILGIVEGITEFLPISSTGHLILASHVMGLAQSDFLKSFEICIQLGAIGAAALLLGKKFYADARMYKMVAAAFIPTAVLGLAAYGLVKRYLLDPHVVAWALMLGGIAMIAIEYFLARKRSVAPKTELSYADAVIVGIAQACAFVPGVSRAAATVCGGLLRGIERRAIVEFSFLLAIPTLGAATLLDLYKNPIAFSAATLPPLAVGFVVSGIIAFFSMKFLLSYITRNSFVGFGIYRICVGVAFLLLVL